MNRTKRTRLSIDFQICMRQKMKAPSCEKRREITLTHLRITLMTVKIFDNFTVWFKFQPSNSTPFSLRTKTAKEKTFALETYCDDFNPGKYFPTIKYVFDHRFFYEKETDLGNVYLMIPTTVYGFVDVVVNQTLENGTVVVNVKETPDSKFHCEFLEIDCKFAVSFPRPEGPDAPITNKTKLSPETVDKSTITFKPPNETMPVPFKIKIFSRTCSLHEGFLLFAKYLRINAQKGSYYCSSPSCNFVDPKCNKTSETSEIPMYYTSHQVVFGVPQGLPKRTLLTVQMSKTCFLKISLNRTKEDRVILSLHVCKEQENEAPSCVQIKKFNSAIKISFMAIKIFDNATIWFKFQPFRPNPFSIITSISGGLIMRFETGCDFAPMKYFPTIKYVFDHSEYFPEEPEVNFVYLMLPTTVFGFVELEKHRTLRNGTLLVKVKDTGVNRFNCDFLVIDCSLAVSFPRTEGPDIPITNNTNLNPGPVDNFTGEFKPPDEAMPGPLKMQYKKCNLYEGFLRFKDYVSEDSIKSSYYCSIPKCKFEDPDCDKKSETTEIPLYFTFHQVVFGVPQGLPANAHATIRINNNCSLQMLMKRAESKEMQMEFQVCDSRENENDSCEQIKSFTSNNFEISFVTIKIFKNDTVWFKFKPSIATPYSLSTSISNEIVFALETRCRLNSSVFYPSIKYVFDHSQYFPEEAVHDSVILMLPSTILGFVDVELDEILENETVLVKVKETTDNTYHCDFLEVNCNLAVGHPRLLDEPVTNMTYLFPAPYNKYTKKFNPPISSLPAHITAQPKKCDLYEGFLLFQKYLPADSTKSSFYCSTPVCNFIDPSCEKISETAEIPMYYAFHQSLFGVPQGLPKGSSITIRINRSCSLKISMIRMKSDEITIAFKLCDEGEYGGFLCSMKQVVTASNVETSFMTLKIFSNATLWFKFQPSNPLPFSLKSSVEGEIILSINTGCDFNASVFFPTIKYVFDHSKYYAGETAFDAVVLMLPITELGFVEMVLNEPLNKETTLVKVRDTPDNRFTCKFLEANCLIVVAYPQKRKPDDSITNLTDLSPTTKRNDSGTGKFEDGKLPVSEGTSDSNETQTPQNCHPYNGYLLFKEYIEESIQSSFICSKPTCNFSDPFCDRTSETEEIPMHYTFHQVVFGVPQGLPKFTLANIQITKDCSFEISLNRTKKEQMTIEFRVCKGQGSSVTSCEKKKSFASKDVTVSFMTIKLFSNATAWFKFQPSQSSPYALLQSAIGEEVMMVDTECQFDTSVLYPWIQYTFNHDYYCNETFYNGVVLMLPPTEAGFLDMEEIDVLENQTSIVKPKKSPNNTANCDLLGIDCNDTWFFPEGRLPCLRPYEDWPLNPAYINPETGKAVEDKHTAIAKCELYQGYLLFKSILPNSSTKSSYMCSKPSCDFNNTSCERISTTVQLPLYNTFHQAVFGVPQGLPKFTLVKIQISKKCFMEIPINRTIKHEAEVEIRVCQETGTTESSCKQKQNFVAKNLKTAFMTIKFYTNSTMWFKFQPSKPNPYSLSGSVEGETVMLIDTDCVVDVSYFSPWIQYTFSHRYFAGEIIYDGVTLMLPTTEAGFLTMEEDEILKNGTAVVKPEASLNNTANCDILGVDCVEKGIFPGTRIPNMPPKKTDNLLPSYIDPKTGKAKPDKDTIIHECALYNGYLLFKNFLKDAIQSSYLCSRPNCDFMNPECVRTSETVQIPMHLAFHQAVFGVPQGLPKFALAKIQVNGECYVEISINRTERNKAAIEIRVCKEEVSIGPSCELNHSVTSGYLRTAFMTIKIFDNSTLWFKFQPSNSTPYDISGHVQEEIVFFVNMSCVVDTSELFPSIQYTFHHKYYPSEKLYYGVTLMLPSTEAGFVDMEATKEVKNDSVFVKPKPSKNNTVHCAILEIDCEEEWEFPGKRSPNQTPNNDTDLNPAYIDPKTGKVKESDKHTETNKCELYKGFLLFRKYVKESIQSSYMCSKPNCDFKDPNCDRTSETVKIPMHYTFHQVVFGVPQGLPKFSIAKIQINRVCYIEMPINRTTKREISFEFRVCRQEVNEKPVCEQRENIVTHNVTVAFMTIKIMNSSTVWFKFQSSNITPYDLSANVEEQSVLQIDMNCKITIPKFYPWIKYTFYNKFYHPGEKSYDGVFLMLPSTEAGFMDMGISKDLKNGSLMVKPKRTPENLANCFILGIDCSDDWMFPEERHPDEVPKEDTPLNPAYIDRNGDPEEPTEYASNMKKKRINECELFRGYKFFRKYFEESIQSSFMCSKPTCDFYNHSCIRESKTPEIPLYYMFHQVVFAISEGLPINTYAKVQIYKDCYLEIPIIRTLSNQLTVELSVCKGLPTLAPSCKKKESFVAKNVEIAFMTIKIFKNLTVWFLFRPSNVTPYDLSANITGETILLIETGCVLNTKIHYPSIQYTFNHSLYYPGEMLLNGVVLLLPSTGAGFLDMKVDGILPNGTVIVKPKTSQKNKANCAILGIDCKDRWVFPRKVYPGTAPKQNSPLLPAYINSIKGKPLPPEKVKPYTEEEKSRKRKPFAE